MGIGTICDEPLRDKNGKAVMLGDILSFNGKIGTVIWWSEQERHYIEFENGERAEFGFYTWIHDDFEVIGNIGVKEAIV